MKYVITGIVSFVLIVAVLIGIGFATGSLGAKYTETVGVAQKNAENKAFHNNQVYIDGVVKDIAKIKLEYERSTDDTEKTALINYIKQSYSNIDPKQINNPTISQWLRDIQSGIIY